MLRSLQLLAYRIGRSVPVVQVAVVGLLALCLVGKAGAQKRQQGQGKEKGKELRVAAAADLQPVLPVLAAVYEQRTGVKISATFGSSATLAEQILNGSPVDVFLGADFTFPEKVVAAGLADTAAPIEYAKGALVVWTRKDFPIQPISVDKLTDPQVKSIAIADEAHAPYGRAAVSALRYTKLYDAVKPKLVTAENIAQAGQFVESGNAQVGLISLTLASSEHFQQVGTFTLVPTVTYPPILQYGVVLKRSERRKEAHAFMDWLLSPEVQGGLAKFGLAAVK